MAAPLNSSALLQIDAASVSTTFAAGFTFTAGRHAIFQCGHFSTSGVITGVTIGGTAATLDSRGISGSTRADIWRANNIAGGTNQAVVTYTGGTDNYVSGGVQEWAAGDGMTLDAGTPGNASGTSAAPSASTAATTSQANTVSIGVVAPNTAVSNGLTDPVGWTQTFIEQNSAAHQSGAGEYKTETLAGVKTVTWGMTSGAWATAIASYKVSGPTITAQPAPAIQYAGLTAIFTITATGTGVLHYQWKANGTNVGTDSSTYTTAALTASDNGTQITCVVTDDAGSTTSSAATLVVLPTSTMSWIRA